MRDEEKLESILAMIDHIYQSDLNFSHLLPMRRGETFEFVKIGRRTSKVKAPFEGAVFNRASLLLVLFVLYFGGEFDSMKCKYRNGVWASLTL